MRDGLAPASNVQQLRLMGAVGVMQIEPKPRYFEPSISKGWGRGAEAALQLVTTFIHTTAATAGGTCHTDQTSNEHTQLKFGLPQATVCGST